MDNIDAVENSEVESSQHASLEQRPQQLVDTVETAVDKGSPCTEFHEVLVAPNSNSEVIPLPHVETSSFSEQPFGFEEKAPDLNEEVFCFSREDSKEKLIQFDGVFREDGNESLEVSVERQDDEQGSGSAVRQVSQEKQTNVELQDLDYWELEDEESSVKNLEQEQLNGSKNIQQIPVENIVETVNSQSPTQFVAVDSDTKLEEGEQVIRQEKQEVNGNDNWKEVKEFQEVSQQPEVQPIMPSSTAVLSDTTFPVLDITSFGTTEKDQENRNNLPAASSLSSSINQESQMIHNSENYSYPMGGSLSEEHTSSSLMRSDKDNSASLTNTKENNCAADENERCLEKSNEKEQENQYDVEIEKGPRNESNETSFVQMDVMTEGPSVNSQQQEETSQSQSKILSLEETKFSETFESRARLHMLGDSQYKEKGWGHVKLQKAASHGAWKLTFSVEPATSIYESKIDTDTKFQRVRAKSVRISGSKEQGKDDFVLQLPDTQVADDLVEFLTMVITEQTKTVSPASSTERNLSSSSSRAHSAENHVLAQKEAEMERVRQHIAELEKRKALVRQSLHKKGKTNSEKTSPLTSSIQDSPTVSNLDTASTWNVISIEKAMLPSNSTAEEMAMPKTDVVSEHEADKEAVEQMTKPGHQNTHLEQEPPKDSRIGQEQEPMQLVLPLSQGENIHSVQEQAAKHPISDQMYNQNSIRTGLETMDRITSSSVEEFSKVMEKIHKLEEYVQEQFQFTQSSLSNCLKREELDSNWNKLTELFTSETESRISLLLSEIDGVVKLLDRNREDNQSEAFTSCRPWSFSDFLTRLHTFRPITWPAKPECIDAVECARRGWRNVGYNLLECEGKYVYFDENVANYLEEVETVRKKITGRGYRFMSLWIGNPCPDAFRQVPWNTICRTVERAKELRDLELSVHLDRSCIDLLKDELEMFSKPTMEDVIQSFALDEERKRNSFFLGIFGWTVEPLMQHFSTSCHETCLHCEYCDIRIVLDSSTDTKFDAEKEHRSFCAFRRGGWKSCLEYLRQVLYSGQVKMEEENEKEWKLILQSRILEGSVRVNGHK
ncbi:hypothetical protein Gasu2_28230 [Galdieria sulphuraria]|nr:hypothetical protein Gasu2_28230 [Galdieria sulphuraria]